MGQYSNVLALLKAFAFVGFDLSRRYCGRGVVEGSVGIEDLRKSRELAHYFVQGHLSSAQ